MPAGHNTGAEVALPVVRTIALRLSARVLQSPSGAGFLDAEPGVAAVDSNLELALQPAGRGHRRGLHVGRHLALAQAHGVDLAGSRIRAPSGTQLVVWLALSDERAWLG